MIFKAVKNVLYVRPYDGVMVARFRGLAIKIIEVPSQQRQIIPRGRLLLFSSSNSGGPKKKLEESIDFTLSVKIQIIPFPSPRMLHIDRFWVGFICNVDDVIFLRKKDIYPLEINEDKGGVGFIQYPHDFDTVIEDDISVKTPKRFTTSPMFQIGPVLV